MLSRYFMLRIATFCLLLGAVYGQSPTGPPSLAWCSGAGSTACQTAIQYNGSNQVTSVCYALSDERVIRPTVSIATTSPYSTQANPAVLTSTVHGFQLGTRPSITIAGGTGNWTVANTTWTATVIDANTLSIPLNSTSLGSPPTTMVFTTTSPRLTIAEWAVQLLSYDGSGNCITVSWANANTTPHNLCSGSTLTIGNSQ